MSNDEISSGLMLQINIKAFGIVLDMVKRWSIRNRLQHHITGKVKIYTMPFIQLCHFGMTTPELYAWFYYGGSMELMQKAYKNMEFLSFPGSTGNQMGGWFRKED